MRNGREDVVVLLAVVTDFLNGSGLRVGRTKAREETNLVDFLDARYRVFEKKAGAY